ncbi:hypothetical protein IE53DRAFT_247186 [Violaceomyces palustris]|uniref:Uncharacterized protein n=1 Tax=Violaceomyces palustris TaxID=1673888 RepID=A0ACD0NNV0_9BASI|nr:hypothetical protein IE53DRAFT_247186 [Violaceomyces palustris]
MSNPTYSISSSSSSRYPISNPLPPSSLNPYAIARFQSHASTSSTAQHDTEVAFAELELLSQNQRKLASLTTRMTSILSGFDKRLVKLEASILPIHKSTQKLTKMSDNIDLTLATLNKTLGHYDVVIDEQPIIKAGPSVRDTNPYMDCISRIIKGLEYLKKSDLKSQEGVMKKMYDLIELGARNLTDVVRDWVTADSEAIDASEYQIRNIPYPVLSPPTQEAIIPIFNYLSTLPVHPRSSYSPLPACLSIYASIRANYLDHCLSPVYKKVQDYATERIGVGSVGAGMVNAWSGGGDDDDGGVSYRRGQAGVKEMLDVTCALLENDRTMLYSLLVTANVSGDAIIQVATFSQLTGQPLRALNDLLTTLHSHVRRNFATHTLFLFDLIGSLSSVVLNGRLDSLLRYLEPPAGSGGRSAYSFTKAELDLNLGSNLVNEVLDAYNRFKSMAMQIFPRFIEDIKLMPSKRELEVPSTSVNEITYTGIGFMRDVVEYSDVISPLLKTLGQGSWMMSSNAAPVLSLGIDVDDESSARNRGIVGDYLNDVLATVLGALESRSRAIRQPSTASIFLLNNIGHLNRGLKAPLAGSGATRDPADACILSNVLGTVGEQLISGAMRSANTAYLDAWGPVISPLMEDGGGLTSNSTNPSSLLSSNVTSTTSTTTTSRLLGGSSNEKNSIKERFTKFSDSLEDLERLHRAYPFSKEDTELKQKLRSEVTRLVLPLYKRFLAKYRNVDFSKNPSKYIRFTEAEVEERIEFMLR